MLTSTRVVATSPGPPPPVPRDAAKTMLASTNGLSMVNSMVPKVLFPGPDTADVNKDLPVL